MAPMITAKGLVKWFGKSAETGNIVLSGVDVTIEEGEFTAIMGPSGSGKTTLLFVLSGMDSVNEGTVSFEDKDLAAYSDNELADVRRTKMGFVFQQPTMLKNLTLLDNILLPAMRGGGKPKALAQKAAALMEKTGIAGLENRNITEVSGGQLQRAGICRAMMGQPRVLFGDEPTGALNSKSADEIMDAFAQINAGGTAVVLVTHDAKVAARARRVLFMRDGQIVREMRMDAYTPEGLEARSAAIWEAANSIEL
jgi:putative ABC transport system ATP-binding protein